jgi:hypothetical protein
VASAEGMCPGEGDDLLVVEAQSVEDLTEVVVSLRSVGESTVTK